MPKPIKPAMAKYRAFMYHMPQSTVILIAENLCTGWLKKLVVWLNDFSDASRA